MGNNINTYLKVDNVKCKSDCGSNCCISFKRKKYKKSTYSNELVSVLDYDLSLHSSKVVLNHGEDFS